MRQCPLRAKARNVIGAGRSAQPEKKKKNRKIILRKHADEKRKIPPQRIDEQNFGGILSGL